MNWGIMKLRVNEFKIKGDQYLCNDTNIIKKNDSLRFQRDKKGALSLK